MSQKPSTPVGNGNYYIITDVFITSGIGTITDLSSAPATMFALQVAGTDSPAISWAVNLEVSLDNLNWTSIITNSTTSGDKTIVYSSLVAPSLYMRANCTSLILGQASNITVTSLGKY